MIRKNEKSRCVSVYQNILNITHTTKPGMTAGHQCSGPILTVFGTLGCDIKRQIGTINCRHNSGMIALFVKIFVQAKHFVTNGVILLVGYQEWYLDHKNSTLTRGSLSKHEVMRSTKRAWKKQVLLENCE